MWLLFLLVSPSHSSNCSGLFTRDDRDGETTATVILAAHNKLRSMIAMGQYGAMGKMFVGASNMEKMVKTSEVTQRACDSWSAEFQQHGLNSTTLTFDQFAAGIGHATQMAWATSSKLGCGVSLCGDGNKQALVVCQYQKQGNMIGNPIYLEGGACSKCPDYAPMCDDAHGLCIPHSATVSPP
ncbi:hypothetical protein PRIPAC_74148, partial [Pristionchus pacificus]|uniref:SCP domain-containing protein n=1 Tax=Pristionchus pacificus TaxID=54126 RepID=A0A2A6D038_PRIPA